MVYLLNKVMANAATSNSRRKILTYMMQLLKNRYMKINFFFKFRIKIKSYDFHLTPSLPSPLNCIEKCVAVKGNLMD